MASRAIALVFAVLLLFNNASACVIGGTGPKPICERFWEHDAVALADVVAINESNFNRTVTLRMIEVFRGDAPVEVTFSDPYSDCGVNFHRKGKHLVWLYKERDTWKAFNDDESTEAADLAFARSMKTAPVTARVFGNVGTAVPNYVVSGAPPFIGKALAGSVVVATGERGRFEAVVQKDGTFALNDLPPGKYTITVEALPPNLEGDPQELELAGGGCKQLYLRPDSSGEISGRLVPEGKMPQHAFVLLKRVPENAAQEDDHDVRFGVDVFADDATGAFSFRHVRPGKYVLAFGDDWEGPTVDSPYEPNRYYRHSKSRDGAEVIELSDGQKIQDLEFNIGSEVPRRTIHVRATWEDGTPAANFHVQLRNTKKDSNLPDEQYTDENGNADLTAFAGISYKLEAAGSCRQASRQYVHILNDVPVRVIDKRTLPDQLMPASAVDSSVTVIVPGTKCVLGRPWWGSDED